MTRSHLVGRRALREGLRLILVLLALATLFVGVRTLGAQPSEPGLDEVAVSRRTAQRLGLRIGDVIEVSADPSMARGRRVRVATIWTSPEHPADVARGDLQVRFHLAALESLLGRSDMVDRVIVRLNQTHGRDAAARLREDLAALGSGYDVYTAGELVQHTSRTFVVISRFHKAIGLIAVAASGIFLITIMALKLTEMRREIGALRLIGIAPGTIGLTVLAVAAAVAAFGGLIGIALGALMVWGINAYYQPLFGTALRFAVLDPQTVVFACGLATVLSLAAGAAVAVQVLRRPPLEQVGR